MTTAIAAEQALTAMALGQEMSVFVAEQEQWLPTAKLKARQHQLLPVTKKSDGKGQIKQQFNQRQMR